ncbi:MAG: DUF1670 domain-containing protein [Candidatus Latescibacteria bacterium]|nr:DUF1670 domain-containing protein [Candidatus Latescibacterota bacterium]
MRRPACQTTAHRARLRSLPALLVNKFLNEYGYDKGPVVAQAIVKDILGTIEGCYDRRVGPRQCMWLAVRADRGKRRTIQASDLIPVRLTLITEEEIAILDDPALKTQARATRRCRQHRLVRMYFEAYGQGGVLTVLDLSLILGVSQKVICGHIHAYEQETEQTVPIRATVHDIGSSVTHKAEVVRRFLRNESPDRIARATHHSQAAVDRYLAAYQRIRLLVQRFPKDQLPTLSGVAPSVVAEYLALIQEYEPQLKLYAAATEENQITVTREGTTDTPQPSTAPLEAAAVGSRRSDGGGAR